MARKPAPKVTVVQPKATLTVHEGVSIHLPPNNQSIYLGQGTRYYHQVATLGHLDEFVKAVRQRSDDKSPTINIRDDGIHWTHSEDL